MKILLLGCNGQVGWELQRSLAPLGELIALGRGLQNGHCGALDQPAALKRTIADLQPNVIVNAAAYTAVDGAEKNPELAERINTHAVAEMAEQAGACGALLVHYSTDYVFDGSGTLPWKEDDRPAPINVYGESKWRGEQVIRAAKCPHLIIRTSWVYAARGRNFLGTMLRLATERDELKVVDDQTGAPTGAELIADVTAQMLPTVWRDTGLGGTYHVTSTGETTWFRYAQFIIRTAREAGFPITVRDDAIQPVISDEFPVAAPRPRNSRLNCQRLERQFGLRLPEWQPGVRRAIEEMVPA